MDETCVGGKPRKKNRKEDVDEHTRGTKKLPVVGVVEREGKGNYTEWRFQQF